MILATVFFSHSSYSPIKSESSLLSTSLFLGSVIWVMLIKPRAFFIRLISVTDALPSLDASVLALVFISYFFTSIFILFLNSGIDTKFPSISKTPSLFFFMVAKFTLKLVGLIYASVVVKLAMPSVASIISNVAPDIFPSW